MSSLNIFRSSPTELFKAATWRPWLSRWRSQLRTVRLDRSDPAFVPLCAALALIAMLVLQFLQPGPTLEPVAMRVPRGALALQEALPADYPAIVKAPVFAPDRLPDPSDAGTVRSAQDIVLIALAKTNDSIVALFKGADGDTYRVLMGGSIDGWRLVAVDDRTATLERTGQRRVVPLTAGDPVPVTPSQTDQTEKAVTDDDSEDQ